MAERYVCDTSVVVDGRVIELLKEKKISGTVYVATATLAELEHQANSGREIGFTGLDVMKKLKEMAASEAFELVIEGPRPTPSQITHAKITGEVDALIRSMAKELDAVLVTGDKVQHSVAEAEGIQTIYLRAREEVGELSFKKYFTPETMSVHIKENCEVVAKIGRPGEVQVVGLGQRPKLEEIRRMSEEIVEAVKRNRSYYFEMDKEGVGVIQMAEYRIVIAKPPFSDGFEITIVHPIKRMRLDEYQMGEKLWNRLDQEAEGIIICGPPGSGKSTFAAALAEYYYSKKKVVKTMESPRDLRVQDAITQYSPLEGSFENTKEILLLVRPDYTFYDEMRKTVDFQIYADMRMAGIGLVGVVHGRKAIDAVQRFINKVDLGMIPQIVDTVILIDKGQPGQIYELAHVVKVPSGMREADLARPVIEVKNFETGEIEFEIYKFGEETVVLPLKQRRERKGGREGGERFRERFGGQDRGLEGIFSKMTNGRFKVEKTSGGFVIRLEPRDLSYFMGKGRNKIRKLEKRYGNIELGEL